MYKSSTKSIKHLFEQDNDVKSVSEKVVNATYSDKLKNPKWQKKRLEILNLKEFKCELCQSEEQELHVHHRFYIKGREPWQYDNDVFQVLCSNCHKNVHDNLLLVNNNVPEKYKKIISLIDSFESYDLDNLTTFLSLDDIKEKLRLISNADCSGWLEPLFDSIRDKETIEQLHIDVWNLQRIIKEINPDLT